MKLEDKVLERLDQTLIAVRDSVPPNLSTSIVGFQKDIQGLQKDMAEMKLSHYDHEKRHIAADTKNEQFQQSVQEAMKRIEPYIKKAEDDRDFIAGLEARGKKLGVWGGIWLTFSAVVGSIYYGLKHIK